MYRVGVWGVVFQFESKDMVLPKFPLDGTCGRTESVGFRV